MRAAVVSGSGKELILEELAEPPLGPLHVRVAVGARGVCDTDLSVQRGDIPYPVPLNGQ